nr:transposase [Streptomyces coelicoflavus]
MLPEAFQRVVPAAPVRPQGGGRRRYGDRQVLAAIVLVATTGCTWRQPPPGFGPSGPTAHRRFTARSRAVSTPYKESRVRADPPKPARHPQKDVRDHRHARYTTAVPGNEPARAVGRQTIHPAYRRSRASGETYDTVPFNAGNAGIRCTWRGDGRSRGAGSGVGVVVDPARRGLAEGFQAGQQGGPLGGGHLLQHRPQFPLPALPQVVEEGTSPLAEVEAYFTSAGGADRTFDEADRLQPVAQPAGRRGCGGQ